MIVKDLSSSFNPIPKQPKKEKKEKTEIKKKSSKLAKLERQRDKDVIKSGICDYCHKYNKRLDPHEVYGGSNRKISMKNGLVKMLCRKCHKDEEILKQLKIETQKEYEKEHTRDEFIKLIGKSYL
jgi:hypothetical protein